MEALDDLGADSGLGDVFAKLFYHMVVDIGFEQGLSDIAHSVRDIGIGDTASACK
jgi:hypothetical protein